MHGLGPLPPRWSRMDPKSPGQSKCHLCPLVHQPYAHVSSTWTCHVGSKTVSLSLSLARGGLWFEPGGCNSIPPVREFPPRPFRPPAAQTSGHCNFAKPAIRALCDGRATPYLLFKGRRTPWYVLRSQLAGIAMVSMHPPRHAVVPKTVLLFLLTVIYIWDAKKANSESTVKSQRLPTFWRKGFLLCFFWGGRGTMSTDRPSGLGEFHHSKLNGCTAIHISSWYHAAGGSDPSRIGPLVNSIGGKEEGQKGEKDEQVGETHQNIVHLQS